LITRVWWHKHQRHGVFLAGDARVASVADEIIGSQQPLDPRNQSRHLLAAARHSRLEQQGLARPADDTQFDARRTIAWRTGRKQFLP
jgi:hypothetical protein